VVDGLVGRADELATILAKAREVADGHPWVVWIEGEAGSGKTSLLRAALRQLPEGYRVLTGEADELATDIAFQLVEQLGVTADVGAFPTGIELLQLWGTESERGPIAVAVEDLHWADSDSRLALLTAVKRLRHDRVLVLVTNRPAEGVADGWERFALDGERCELVPVGTLSSSDVGEMARRSGIDLTPASAERLFRHTGGLALYVRTLLRELSPERLNAPEGELPAPRSLASTTVARLSELSQPARGLAAALAVVNHRVSLPVVGRVAGLDQPAQALDELVMTGFVVVTDDEPPAVEFVHPLYRAAVYGDLAPSRRQELHRQAAEVVVGELALAHRVAAADVADDKLAELLDAEGRRARERHRWTLAAKYLLWSSELSSRSSDAEQRLLRAARVLVEEGRLGEAEEMRPRLEACRPSPLRSLVLGGLAASLGEQDLAEALLNEAAEPVAGGEVDRGPHVEIRAAALAGLGILYLAEVRPADAFHAAETALSLSPEDPDVERKATGLAAFSLSLLVGAKAGVERIDRRLPARSDDVAPEDVDLLATRGSLAWWSGRLHDALADHRTLVRLARVQPTAQLPIAHVRIAELLYELGEWDEALVHAHVAISLAADVGGDMWVAEAHLAIACVLASRGEFAAADEHAELAPLGVVGSAGEHEAMFRLWQGVRALARGDTTAAAAALGPMGGVGEASTAAFAVLREARLLGLGVVWWPRVIAALIDAGDLEHGSEQLEEFRGVVVERQLGFAAPLAGLQARLDAAGGDAEAAAEGFRQAIAAFGRDDLLLDRALLHRAFGRLLLARGERHEAVDEFRTAHELFSRVGAAAFVGQIDADLAGAGMAVPRTGTRASRFSLTERESDVVALVAKGLTNTEVSAQLYVSINTVEYHLRNVFAKLGVKSRRELRAVAP
jgi:DNA-binding CsgD family transcriptional regulator/predicted negative regulator of RcsB-dependent stress response